jgi:MFS family permease
MRGPFQNRSFRRLFAGRVVTNLGDSFYFVAAMWIVYSLTGSAFYSGVAGFLTLAPSALQFLAGPLVDRWSVRRTLTGTQLVQAVVVALVPVVHAAGLLTVEVVLVVMPLLAALNQLVYPAQSAALPRLLDDEDLVAANSAFSMAYQGVEMVANGIGGLLIGLVGAVALFAVDAVTFGLAALLFATVTVPAAGEEPDDEGADSPAADSPAADSPAGDSPAADVRGEAVAPDGGNDATGGGPEDTEAGHATGTGDDAESYLERLRAGASFLRGTFLVWLVAGAAVVNFTSGMVLASLPAYADALGTPAALDVLGDAGAYGVLMMAFAAGNLGGAVGASAVDDYPYGWTMVAAFGSTGVLWTAALVAGWLPLTAALVALAALPVGLVNVQLSAVVQSAPPEEFVGRVSSVLGSAASASVPVGSLVGGTVAAAVSPVAAMSGLGLGAVGLALYVLVLPGLRDLPAPAEVELRSGAA